MARKHYSNSRPGPNKYNSNKHGQEKHDLIRYIAKEAFSKPLPPEDTLAVETLEQQEEHRQQIIKLMDNIRKGADREAEAGEDGFYSERLRRLSLTIMLGCATNEDLDWIMNEGCLSKPDVRLSWSKAKTGSRKLGE